MAAGGRGGSGARRPAGQEGALRGGGGTSLASVGGRGRSGGRWPWMRRPAERMVRRTASEMRAGGAP